MKVIDILRTEPQSITIIEKYGLNNMACHNFEDACFKHAIDPQIVKYELICLRVSLQANNTLFNQILKDALHQHEAIKKTIPQIRSALLRATKHNPKVLCVKNKFETLIENLEVHLYKEENILFPEFMKLSKGGQGRSEVLSFPMMYPIEGLEAEHERVSEILDEITALIRVCCKLNPADRHSNQMYIGLQVFGKQVKELMKRENQLFPQALTLEEKF